LGVLRRDHHLLVGLVGKTGDVDHLGGTQPADAGGRHRGPEDDLAGDAGGEGTECFDHGTWPR